MAADEDYLQSQLRAAHGWLELGNWREANEELEQLPPEIRAERSVLEVRCKIYAADERWADLELIAAGASALYPERSVFYLHRGWAMHRQGRSEEGLKILGEAAKRLPGSAWLPYMAACSAGALNRIEEARRWLALAFERTPDPDTMKLKTLEEPELAPLWSETEVR